MEWLVYTVEANDDTETKKEFPLVVVSVVTKLDRFAGRYKTYRNQVSICADEQAVEKVLSVLQGSTAGGKT